MKIISHRGNLNGPNLLLENSLDYIQNAIDLEFIVEVDLRFSNNNLYFGHDFAQYPVSVKWILDRKDLLLVHVKDSIALEYIIDMKIDINFFVHQNDDFTMISNGYIWTHNINCLNKKSIVPLINIVDKKYLTYNYYGICTDFPIEYKKIINEYNKL